MGLKMTFQKVVDNVLITEVPEYTLPLHHVRETSYSAVTKFTFSFFFYSFPRVEAYTEKPLLWGFLSGSLVKSGVQNVNLFSII